MSRERSRWVAVVAIAALALLAAPAAGARQQGDFNGDGPNRALG